MLKQNSLAKELIAEPDALDMLVQELYDRMPAGNVNYLASEKENLNFIQFVQNIIDLVVV